MNSIALDPQSQAMMALFSSEQVTDANRQSLLDDPLAALASIGIEVDAVHRDAVAQGLRAVVLSHASAAPAGLLKAKRAPNEFEKYIHVAAKPWGVVVRIDHEAISQLPRGLKAIEPLAEGIGAVMAVSSALGPAAVAIFGGLAFWSAVLTAYVLILPAIDRGKGVYLTITWPQMAAVVASGGLLGFSMLPIPTAVL
ncbi:MAG: hypothetical protein KIS62_12925 [Ramlibacter sp.]|nr:hypothetical protein [Ramlibacter sp.]MCW5650642.1 hypothetical protein [Ramlibacter sp.]